MIDQNIGRSCTGCYTCENICGINAIRMTADSEGFVYPAVDRDKCVNCGRCLAACPVLNKPDGSDFEQPEVYAAWHVDPAVRLESTSGGVFSALAETVLSQGGHVVGACYDADFHILHTIIHRVEDIPLLRQSKYAQSDVGLVFRAVKKLLDQQQTVLFCGTPCQCAGLQRYLVRKYDNLCCCDFICRGVISPKVYKKFLQDMRPDGERLKKIHFKNKDFGWNRFSTKLTFGSGQIYHKDRDHDYYMRGYLKYNLYLRPSCHQCQYKSIPRTSDISMGDFWGIGNFDPALDNEMGTSVVLVNSAKGREIFSQAQQNLHLSRRSLEEVLAGNSCLLNAAAPGKYRDYFFRNLDRYTFGTLIEKIQKKSARLKPMDWVLQKLSIIKRTITGEMS